MRDAVIYLVRHGETDDNVPPQRFQGHRDTELNDTGRRQAAELARRATGLDLRTLYASHLKRARQTADPVARGAGLVPIVDARLAEGWRGDWEGRLVSEVEREQAVEFAAWCRAGAGFRFPGGESLADLKSRVLAAMADVARGPLPALVVSHGGAIRCVLLHLSGHDLGRFHEPAVPNGEPIPLDERDRAVLAGT